MVPAIVYGSLVPAVSIGDTSVPEGQSGTTTAQITEHSGNGDYLVEGVKFQMGGWWKIDFTIEGDGQAACGSED